MQIMNKKSGICYEAFEFNSNTQPFPDNCVSNINSKTGYSYKSIEIKKKQVICEDGTIFDIEYKDGFEIWQHCFILTQSDGVQFPITAAEKQTLFEDI